MNQIEKEELKIKVEYGIAIRSVTPIPTVKNGRSVVIWRKELIFQHRSGRRTSFSIPEEFHKLIYCKLKGKTARKIIEFAMATYRFERVCEDFVTVYAIAIKHKSDNFRRSIARKIVTGRIKRYLKDKYASYKGFDWKSPDFIHVEQGAD